MDGKFFKYIARRADHYYTFLFPESIFIVKRNTHTRAKKKKKMTLNLDKTKCMLIGSNKKRVNIVYHYYLLLFIWLASRPAISAYRQMSPPPQGERARALGDSTSWPCELEKRHVFSFRLHEIGGSGNMASHTFHPRGFEVAMLLCSR